MDELFCLYTLTDNFKVFHSNFINLLVLVNFNKNLYMKYKILKYIKTIK